MRIVIERACVLFERASSLSCRASPVECRNLVVMTLLFNDYMEYDTQTFGICLSHVENIKTGTYYQLHIKGTLKYYNEINML